MEEKKIEGNFATLEISRDSGVLTVVKTRLAHLLSVKSLVTIILTGVFAFMAVTGQISQDFMTIYAVIIAFYFGTQSKAQETSAGGGSGAEQ